MKGEKIKISEARFRKIVESKVRKMLRESDMDDRLKSIFGGASKESFGLFDEIEGQLAKLGEGIYISKFFSDPNRIMVMTRGSNTPVDDIVNVMKQYGYTYNNERGIDWMQFRKGNDLQESVKRALKRTLREMNEVGQPGSISSGTMNPEDLIPRFMSELFRSNPGKAREIWQQYPNLLQALCDKQAGVPTDWFQSEEASEILNNDIFDALDSESPEGHSFGSHPGDGSDYGYWQNDLSESIKKAVRSALKEMSGERYKG